MRASRWGVYLIYVGTLISANNAPLAAFSVPLSAPRGLAWRHRPALAGVRLSLSMPPKSILSVSALVKVCGDAIILPATIHYLLLLLQRYGCQTLSDRT